MRDYGKNGKKCKHAYADGGKVIAAVRRQDERDRSGVRIPDDPQFMPQEVRSEKYFPNGVAESRGPRGAGKTVAPKPNPRATPKRPSEPEREGTRTANMAKAMLKKKPEATPGGKRGGR